MGYRGGQYLALAFMRLLRWDTPAAHMPTSTASRMRKPAVRMRQHTSSACGRCAAGKGRCSGVGGTAGGGIHPCWQQVGVWAAAVWAGWAGWDAWELAAGSGGSCCQECARLLGATRLLTSLVCSRRRQQHGRQARQEGQRKATHVRPFPQANAAPHTHTRGYPPLCSPS